MDHLPTAELADAADVPIAMHHRIKAVWPGVRLAGPAFTVQTPPGEHPSVRRAADEAAAGAVIVVDGGGAVDRRSHDIRVRDIAKAVGITERHK